MILEPKILVFVKKILVFVKKTSLVLLKVIDIQNGLLFYHKLVHYEYTEVILFFFCKILLKLHSTW